MQQEVRPPIYSSVYGASRVLLGLFALLAVSDAIAIASDFAEISMLSRMIDGEFVSTADLNANDNRQAAIGTLQLIIGVATGVTFLVWFYRAHKNVLALGISDPGHTARWAVAVWFIPIWNFFRPYQITKDIALASDPARRSINLRMAVLIGSGSPRLLVVGLPHQRITRTSGHEAGFSRS